MYRYCLAPFSRWPILHVKSGNRRLSSLARSKLIGKDILVFSSCFSKKASTHSAGTQISSDAVGFIPEPPELPVNLPEITQLLAERGEGLHELGLGKWYTPAGWFQNGLDALHSNFGLPWWAAIVTGTLAVRTLTLPVLVMAHKNSAKMNNNMPAIQELQVKLQEAQRRGDQLETVMASMDLNDAMKKVSGTWVFIGIILFQSIVFMSMFLAIRGMAKRKVKDMDKEGHWWFSNLTTPDPMYILPLISCATMLVMLETGAEFGVRANTMPTIRYVFRAFPFVLFFFIKGFPAAVVLYWTTANIFSLIVTTILRQGPIRRYLNIPAIIKHDKSKLPLHKRGFLENIRQMKNQGNAAYNISNRIDTVQEMQRFRASGTAPIKKTYAYDPTEVRKKLAGADAVNKRRT